MRSRRLTFLIWVVAVTGSLGGQLFHAGICRAISLACLIVIFALLCTTPANAIRLPRLGSEIFMLITTAVLRAHTGVPGLIHLGITAAILALLRLSNQSAWWAVLYSWMPIF